MSALEELATTVHPLLYLVSTVVLNGVFGIPSPYSFLRLHTDANVPEMPCLVPGKQRTGRTFA